MSVKPLSELLESTYSTLKSKLPEKLLSPKVGIVCGSGLSTLADSLQHAVLVPYDELEGFGRSTGVYVIYTFSNMIIPYLMQLRVIRVSLHLA